jgi:hypothetical protein
LIKGRFMAWLERRGAAAAPAAPGSTRAAAINVPKPRLLICLLLLDIAARCEKRIQKNNGPLQATERLRNGPRFAD